MISDNINTSDITHESDYEAKYDASTAGEFLPGTSIEVIREPKGRGEYRHVLFDFDGTLSLIREGWPEVMIPLMVEILLGTGTRETPEELYAIARDFVSQLTGKQTIYQMIRLAEEITKRGGTPEDPLVYKHMYLDRLMQRIESRREALKSGKAKKEDMTVPGTFDLLRALVDRGLPIYLASGTDEPFVKEEAEMLGLTDYFGKHVYGAVEDYKTFSKALVIQRILKQNNVDGAHLLGFGDAYVEIDNVKSVGGTGIGVASDEAARSGKPDAWKRTRLVSVGADIIIPDYRECDTLLRYLMAED